MNVQKPSKYNNLNDAIGQVSQIGGVPNENKRSSATTFGPATFCQEMLIKLNFNRSYPK